MAVSGHNFDRYVSTDSVRWLFRSRLLDSFWEIDEAKFFDLKYVGRHASKISVEDIGKCLAEMKRVYRSNITRRVSNRKKQLRNLYKLLEENEEEIVKAIEADLGRCALLAAAYDIYPVLGEIKKFLKNVDSWSAPQRMGVSLLTFPSYDVHVVEPYGTVFVNGIWKYVLFGFAI